MCLRCQRAGHTATNCKLEFRCVKCIDKHEAGECSIKKGEKLDLSKIYCIRCKSFGHPASYKGCPKFKEIKNRLAGKMAKRTENKVETLNKISNNLSSQTYRPNVSFAQMVKGNPNSQSNKVNENSQKEKGERRWNMQPSSSHSETVTSLTQEDTPKNMGDHMVDFKSFIVQHLNRLENLISHNTGNIQKLHDLYFGYNSSHTETNVNTTSANLISNE